VAEDVFIETVRLTDGGTVAVSTVPSSVSRRYLYSEKFTNEGGNAKLVEIKQLRHANSFTDTTMVPAEGGIEIGGNPTQDRLLPFDSGGTVQVEMSATSGTIDVALGFKDL